MSYTYMYKNLTLNINDKQLIEYVLNVNDGSLDFNKLKSPIFLFEYTFNSVYKESVPVFQQDDFVLNDNMDEDDKFTSDPLVYIFNSHPVEEYVQTNFEVFNISPSVLTAAYILEEVLEDYGINVIVETRSAVDILYANNWTYSKSYDASRILLEEAYEKNNTLKYFIDIHRDSSSKSITTMDVDGVSCARFLFVVGLNYDTYEKNLVLHNKVNDELNLYADKFSRGVITKTGAGVNGVYNQDFHENLLLIEIGGQYNTIDEVSCATKYLGDVLADIIYSMEE